MRMDFSTAGLMVMMILKAAHLGQYQEDDGGVGQGLGPSQQEGLAWLASERKQDRAGVFCAIVICDIKVGVGVDGYSHSLFDPIFGAGQ